MCTVVVADGVGVLFNFAASNGDDIWRVDWVEFAEERSGLARVEHEEDGAVAPLRTHLLQRVAQILRVQLLVVLKLEKIIAAVTRQIDENIRSLVREQAFGARSGVAAVSAREQTEEGLHGDLGAPIVHLDARRIEVERVRLDVEHRRREGVARIACVLVGEKKKDLRVGDAHRLEDRGQGRADTQTDRQTTSAARTASSQVTVSRRCLVSQSQPIHCDSPG